MRSRDLYALPDDLPVPIDDGAYDHLLDSDVPDVELVSTHDRLISLAIASDQRRVVVFCYPRTGVPDREPAQGWNEIPGARGCTPHACGFRDLHGVFQELGTDVFGLSVQDTSYQREMALRLGLPFEVLSDEHYTFTSALRLPTFTIENKRLLKRATLVFRQRRVERVFYPVFPPGENAVEVVAWLRSVVG